MLRRTPCHTGPGQLVSLPPQLQDARHSPRTCCSRHYSPRKHPEASDRSRPREKPQREEEHRASARDPGTVAHLNGTLSSPLSTPLSPPPPASPRPLPPPPLPVPLPVSSSSYSSHPILPLPPHPVLPAPPSLSPSIWLFVCLFSPDPHDPSLQTSLEASPCSFSPPPLSAWLPSLLPLLFPSQHRLCLLLLPRLPLPREPCDPS
eukprot:3108367-Rhodomonas_salina.1